MTNDPVQQGATQSGERQPYTRPELTIFGNVEKLTQGGLPEGRSDAPLGSGNNPDVSS